MAGYVRRFREFPSLERLTEIEAINIVDLTPPASINGAGSGTMLVVGEWEDGPFAAGGDSPYWDGDSKGLGVQEVFTAEDRRQRFGGFGFTYGSLIHQNPCARRHLSELWNGNGYIKTKFLRPARQIIARVDTSVGEVAYSMQACIEGADGPFNLGAGATLSVTTDVGGPAASDAVAATAAVAAGAAGTFPTGFAGGETIGILVDGGPQVNVVFSAADSLLADVISKINDTVGLTIASDNASQLDITGIQLGTGGSIQLVDVTPGTLAVLGHSAGTTAGTGNVADATAVTAAEVAAIINGSAALTAIDCSAVVTSSGNIRICSDTAGSGTVLVAAGAMATELELDPIGTAVAAGTHAAGEIPAGSRVSDGAASWVTMQTLTIPAGTAADPVEGPFTVKVRPALDDGTGTAATAGTVTTATDQPDFGQLVVTNPSGLSAALTEPQMDVAYESAFDRTIDLNISAREANHSLSARQSSAVDAKMESNAIQASQEGMFGRKATVGAPIGYTMVQAIGAVGNFRQDRVNYCWPGWQVRIPEIAAVGAAGGLGFNDTGIITVRGDGPLASINCQLNPEENPGQRTNLIDEFFDIERQSTPLGQSSYIALKAAGICSPRVDRVSGSIYQSGITSVDPSTDPSLVTQARRKMADFIQDSIAEFLVPFSKKLNTQARRASIAATVAQFLEGLLSTNAPENARIESFLVDEVSGNTPELLARGIFVLIIKVRTLSSLDAIVLQTEIGEGVVTVTEQ